MANSSGLPAIGDLSSSLLMPLPSSDDAAASSASDTTSPSHYSTCSLVDKHAAIMHTAKPPSVTVVVASAAATILLLSSSIFLWRRRRRVAGKAKPDGSANTSRPKKRATLEDVLRETDGQLTVKPIGAVRSLYRLCVGTPRQGLLVPHARGRLELTAMTMDAVQGLDEYSHVWVVFVFHLNTMGRRVPNKIAPPALGGTKVGTLATRSPHRFNPIGITLCRLDSIRASATNTPILDVSGLDLVDTTPILDVKPYVPHYDSVSPSAEDIAAREPVRVPSWVEDGLKTRRPVRLESQALEELERIVVSNPNALDFYGKPRGDASTEETLEALAHCIDEVLSVDVRSAWQTQKARKGRFQAERAERMQIKSGRADRTSDAEKHSPSRKRCTQQLDNLLIHYYVEAPEEHAHSASHGSGAEDTVYVHSVELLDSCNKVLDTQGDDEKAALTIDPREGALEALDTDESLASEARDRSSPIGGAPTDGDYGTLKNYWNQAASKNTPTGLVPVDTSTGMPLRGRGSTHSFFAPETSSIDDSVSQKQNSDRGSTH